MSRVARVQVSKRTARSTVDLSATNRTLVSSASMASTWPGHAKRSRVGRNVRRELVGKAVSSMLDVLINV